MIKRLGLILALVWIFSAGKAQQVYHEIKWNPVETVNIGDSVSFERLSFDDAVYHETFAMVPYYEKVIDIPDNLEVSQVILEDQTFGQLETEARALLDPLDIPAKVDLSYHHVTQRGNKKMVLRIRPLQKSASGLQKLTSFSLNFEYAVSRKSAEEAPFKENSVLRQGDWYKFRLDEDGMYKLTYSRLKNWGVDVDNLDLNKIGVFGNTGLLLPEMNSAERPRDLTENPVIIYDNGDGSFDNGDYILFYGKGTVEWEYNSLQFKFNHSYNHFSDYSYYFFTPDQGTALEPETMQQSSQQADELVTTYDNYQLYENNKHSLIESGREWFGERLDLGRPSFTVPEFTFENIVEGSRLYLQTDIALKSTITSDVNVYVNGEKVYHHRVIGLDPEDYQYAFQNNHRDKFDEQGNDYEVRLEYDVPSSSSLAWLNYVALSARCNLVFNGNQLAFRDAESRGADKIVRFRVEGRNQDMQIWDVSNPIAPAVVDYFVQGAAAEFVRPADQIYQYIAFDRSQLKQPEFVSKVENQNLHAVKNVDYLIIAHPDFTEQAKRIAEFHQQLDNLSYYIAYPHLIYNEFSSGGQDITGIRDFVRNVYHTSDESKRPKYLLMFGNSSYDFHDRVENNTNFVPSFPSYESLNISNTYVTDDYFALMDESEGLQSPEGDNLIGFLDIGVGRFPVENLQQAENLVDKIIHYASSNESFGSWRNEICIIADDEDNNVHLQQAERLAAIVDTGYHQYNLHKIFLDAYRQESTPGGQRYPAVNDAIKARMENGVFIMNYTGHGGEVSLAHERIIGVSDIEGWSNYDALPLFITATCEFSRFDNPHIVSAGEKVLRNPGGGSIAMLTTTRLAFSHTNSILNVRVFKKAFERDENGNYPRLGDLVIASKTPNNGKLYQFVLLGDPALKLAYPENRVVTNTINGVDINSSNADTLKALKQVTIEGQIQSTSGAKLSQFNGEIFPVVYDKEYTAQTRGNDPGSHETSFELQNNILYRGKATVSNGEFSFTFVVPKDIDYEYANGKLSYYAASESTDATGYYNEVIVGGTSESTGNDQAGPEITLFMNDREFENGEVVNQSPMLIADLYDESGLNTVGNGIGHDLLAMIDDDINKLFVLNDFYSAGLDSYKSGTVNYPFNNLEVGLHKLTVTAWDVHNNSSQKSIEFYVSDDITPKITSMRGVPNPFSESTEIYLEHNLFNERVTVSIQVHDISGRLIRRLGPFDLQSDGYLLPPIYWDGNDNSGNRADKGVYIYNILIIGKNDLINRTGGKLIKLD